MVGALGVAASSAAFFAIGGALQHREAGASSASTKTMIAKLIRQPSWLVGVVLCLVAFCLHAVALSLGDLTLVQPVILSGIVITVFARAAIDRRLPSLADMMWVAVTWLGLVIFLAALRPGAARALDTPRALEMAAAGIAIVGVLILVSRHGRPLLRGLVLAGAAGILYGLVAGLLKITTVDARQGLAAAVTGWSLWALLAIGAGAVLLNQLAYQATRISVSASVLNLSQLMVSMTFGVVVLGEHLFGTPGSVAVEVAGLALVALGVTRLAVRAAAADDQPAEETSTDEDSKEETARTDAATWPMPDRHR